MCKKNVLLSALLLTFTHYASDGRLGLEIKSSYFFFSASPMNAIYDVGGFQMQGSISAALCYYFDFYVGFGYRKVHGHALNTREKTSLTVMPLDIGLKAIFHLSERASCFFAIGPRYFLFNQQNNSLYVDNKIKGGGIGFFVHTGLNVLLAKHLLLGVFGEYSYEKKKISPKRPNVFSDAGVQIGGFAVGVSVRYAF